MKTRFLPRTARLALLLILSLTTYLSYAAKPSPVTVADTTTGIKFFTGSWSQLLAEAKKQNKPVFVDVFTTWCGPCKLMAKQAFPDKAVGTLFNANFINYQIDAEKGEGLDVAKRYAVTAYPTSLFVSADGNLIQRTVGYGGIKGLMDEASKAVEVAKDPKPMAAWDKEFADGKRDADFLKTYLTKRAALGMPNAEALEMYLSLIPEANWTAVEHLPAIGGNLTTSRSKAFDPLYKHAMSVRMADRKMYQTIMTGIRFANRADYKEAVTKRDAGQLDRLITNERKYLNLMLLSAPIADEVDRFAGDGYRLSFYAAIKDWNNYRTIARNEGAKLLAIPIDSIRASDAVAHKNYLRNIAESTDSVKNRPLYNRRMEGAVHMKKMKVEETAMRLNTIAFAYVDAMPNPADLKQALIWSGRSLELERSHMFLNTYANLLGKLGRKDEAIRYEEEALALAKAAGEDTAGYEKTIAELRK